jgi:hypothetical protein
VTGWRSRPLLQGLVREPSLLQKRALDGRKGCTQSCTIVQETFEPLARVLKPNRLLQVQLATPLE